ncbi:hypothetical protein, partial [Streptomyces sp. SID3212]|uniref:hypothetical protein n=1 Tax=Streptomyces sp. SID3212 TaxID=2690259 RepID=UPI0013702137
GDAATLGRAVERARGIADVTGLDAYINSGGVAVTPGQDGDGGATAEIHLLESADGSPTTWLRISPRTGNDTGENATHEPPAPAAVPNEPAPRGTYRRTGPYAAELDGTVFALHDSPVREPSAQESPRQEPSGEGDRSADHALLLALRYAAPATLANAGIDTPADLRDWLGRNVTDHNLPRETPLPLDGGRMIPLELLDEIGAPTNASQRMEAVLLGNQLPVSDVALGPAERFRLLLRDPSYGGENGTAALADAVVATAPRALGVELAVVDLDGQVTYHGGARYTVTADDSTPDDHTADNTTTDDSTRDASTEDDSTEDGHTATDTPPALLVLDGDRHLAGLPYGPGDTTGASEARTRRVVEAVSSAPVSVRQRLATRQAPDWIRARIRFLEEAERFEERLGRYLGDHEAANAQLGVMVRAVWDRAVAAGRWAELGSADPTTDGAVGTDRDRIEAVVESGNLRERMGLLWIGAPHPAGGLISDLLSTPAPMPRSIVDEYAERLPSNGITTYRAVRAQTRDLPPEERARLLAEAERPLRTAARPDTVRPPLSEAERALMPDEDLAWIPGRNRWDYAMSSRFQAATEPAGGLVLAGTSGSSQRLMTQAVAMRDVWGLDLDLGLVRIALLAEMLTAEHHSLHEIMRGCQLVFDQLRERGTPESPDLDYIDNWGRYWRIAPLTESELREHVAVDGGFPDEHAWDATGRPAGAGPEDPTGEEAEWLSAYGDTLQDIRNALLALASGAVPDSADGSLAEMLSQILNDLNDRT